MTAAGICQVKGRGFKWGMKLILLIEDGNIG